MVRLAPTILPCLLGLFVIHFTHASPIPAGLDRRIVTKSPILTELDLASLEGESGINKFFQSRAPADSMKRSGRPDSDSSDITEADFKCLSELNAVTEAEFPECQRFYTERNIINLGPDVEILSSSPGLNLEEDIRITAEAALQ